MGNGTTLSVCMIVRDESPVLARCLDGVKLFADEIIIVDTGSADDTKQIALRYTDKVYDFPWIDDFSAARNVSYSYASMEYIMWIDADDVVTPEDAAEINKLKQTLPAETDVVYMLYGGYKDQKNIYNNSTVLRDRWVRRSLGPVWKGRLHEKIDHPPSVKKYFAENIMLRHCKVRVNDPERNMRIHKLCMAEQKEPVMRDMGFLCNEYFSKGCYDDAIAVFDELTEQEPFPTFDIINALFSYIWCFKVLKKTDKLIERLHFLKERGIVNEMLLCELGAAYLSQKNYAEAERYLLEALDTAVDHKDMTVHFEAYHEFIPCQKLSKLYALQGKRELAYEYFLRAEKIYPENRSVKLDRLFFSKRNGSTSI